MGLGPGRCKPARGTLSDSLLESVKDCTVDLGLTAAFEGGEDIHCRPTNELPSPFKDSDHVWATIAALLATRDQQAPPYGAIPVSARPRTFQSQPACQELYWRLNDRLNRVRVRVLLMQ